MEPLAALGLASAIAQLLDFSGKILRQAKRFYSDKESERYHSQIRELATDLSDLCQNLTARSSPFTGSSHSKEEQDLCNLAVQCNTTTEELAEILGKICGTVGDAVQGHAWKSIRTAFVAVKSEGAIEKLSQLMDQYRSQLTLRLLLVLNTHHSTHTQKLDSLQEASKEIIEVISLNYRDLSSSIRANQEATVAAIFTSRDGSTRTLTAPNGSQYISDSRFSTTSTMYGAGYQHSEATGEVDDLNFNTTFGTDIKSILNALHFREIRARRGAITEAHRNTFDWIWQDHKPAEDVQWDDLAKWLRADHGCYWLSGKAGCGKSSLMKYLHEDPRTMTALKAWAGNDQLVTGSFYFWYAGSELQRSQMGLLRSLLYDILSVRPDMCLILFPDVCRSLLSGKVSGRDLTLTDTEIFSGFSALATRTPKDMKLFFFVDGLDEYSGNHNDICDLFSRTAASKRIKILFSSRPIPVCVYQFSSFPKLALQDLTRSDIRRYTWDNLGSHPVLLGMETVEGGIATTLFEDITSKACGVFLWVVLVVKRLLVCLQNYDTMEDLTNEIETLPSDLEKLYEHMLGSQSIAHRVLGSKYLQLVLFSMDIKIDLHLLQLSFAEGDDYTVSLKSPIGNLAPEAEKWRCESVEGRLRSRCCGLIEATSVKRDGESDRSLTRYDKKVEFLHRTVAEFLRLDYIWRDICSLTAQSTFNTQEALVSSSLAEFKAVSFTGAPMPTSGPSRENPLVWRLFRMLSYHKHLDETFRDKNFYGKYLPEFKRVIQYYWHDPSLFSSFDEEFRATENSARLSASKLKLSKAEAFVLSCLIRTPIQELDRKFRTMKGFAISISAVHMASHFVDEPDERIRLSMASSLLLGLQPSYSYSTDDGHVTDTFHKIWRNRWRHLSYNQNSLCTPTMWEYFLHYIFAITRLPLSQESRTVTSTSGMMLSLLEVILMLMRADENFTLAAHPEVFILVKDVRSTSHRPHELSDIQLLAELLCCFWSKAKAMSPAGTSETLARIAELSCNIENLITRQNENCQLFHSTVNDLAVAQLSDAAVKKMRKRKFFSRNRLGFHGKTSAASGNREMVIDLHLVETPWRVGSYRGA